MTRILVLVAGKRTRRYPLPDGIELRDEYELDGHRWTVVAVLTTEDVPLPTAAPNNDVTCACGTPLVRNGVTVTEHWIGDRCDPCDRRSRQQTLTEVPQ